ncbi:MAG TPA: hypothetical protein VKL40_06620 [Candidatus Angelobacter sp.]|nr:hypothetical protein [Candidatus Angelobacter sp.]
MNRFKMLLIGAALMTVGSALATAQPYDHDWRGREDRAEYRGADDHDRGWHKGWYKHRGDSDDRRFFRDRDDWRFYRDRDERRFFVDGDDRRFFDRDDRRFFVGERRFFNGYYWTWDGDRWCRRDGRFVVYFRF